MSTAVSVQRLRWLLLALGLVLAVRHCVGMPALITGASMLPTLRGGQLVGINKLAYRFGKPRRGEVVGVWTGSGLMIKRVLGLPAENIALRDGIFYVNGAPLTEPYVQFQEQCNIAPGQLGPDHFVVAGDNRRGTIIAVVNRNRIVGRVLREPFAAQSCGKGEGSKTISDAPGRLDLQVSTTGVARQDDLRGSRLGGVGGYRVAVPARAVGPAGGEGNEHGCLGR